MKRVQFAISWVYSELRIARLEHNKPTDVWAAPGPVTSLAEFHESLVAASSSLRMNAGGDVAIIFESDQHTHVFLELPPMRRRDLERYLERRVAQEKQFEGEAVWGYRSVETRDALGGVLLHVMPREYLDAIIRICQENHLTPMRLLPLTDVIAQQLPDLYEQAQQVVVTVALLDERIEIVVGNGSGEVLFVRALNYQWDKDQRSRLLLDIERTALYVKQRQQSVSRVCFMGREALSAANVLGDSISFAIDSDERTCDENFWLQAVSTLDNTVTSNFIPKSVQMTAIRHKILRAGSWITMAAMIGALSVTAWVEYLVQDKTAALASTLENIRMLEQREDELLSDARELGQLQARVSRLNAGHPPVPAWLLSHLGTMTPDQVRLDRAEVLIEDGQWKFKFAGVAASNLVAAAEVLTEFEADLGQAPWQAKTLLSWQHDWMGHLRGGRAVDDEPVEFSLEGALF